MEIRIPYEVVKEAVDKAGNPEEPGTAIVFPVWDIDNGNEYEIVIARPKEWLTSKSHNPHINPLPTVATHVDNNF